MLFILSKEFSSLSRYSILSNFFLSFPQFPGLKGQIRCELANVIFGMTQKLLKKKNFSKYFVLQSQERLQTSFRPLLFFIIFSIKRDWLQREKIKLTLYKK